MTICSQGGIGRIAATGNWTHPQAILGYLLGTAILLVAASIFFNFKLPFITSQQQAFRNHCRTDGCKSNQRLCALLPASAIDRMKTMTQRKLSRRDFLKTAGITLGASALTCSGLGYLATLPPEFEMIDTSLGEQDTMSKKILITYATKAGSTVEIAAFIGESLSKRGFAVDVKPVSEKPALDGYQAVLMGSAIRMGSWLPEAVDFVRQNQAALNSTPDFDLHRPHAQLRVTTKPAAPRVRRTPLPCVNCCLLWMRSSSKENWIPRHSRSLTVSLRKLLKLPTTLPATSATGT